MRRVRQIRVLVYEGPEDWVERTVKSDHRYVIGKRIVAMKKPDHMVMFGDPLPMDPPRLLVEDKTITEHISEPEELFNG